MALHLLKLCVGADSVADLENWIAQNAALAERLGHPYQQKHTTRMVPKRLAELEGGSLYWVIKGRIAARQRLLEVAPFTDEQGIGRCHLVLDHEVVAVEPWPHRPFQGWRYLSAEAVPPDMRAIPEGAAEMPESMRRDLMELGLL